MKALPIGPTWQRNGYVPRKERGAVAVIVALSLVVLVGFVGLALDLGKLFVAKTELQNSADACALAAARELTGANINQLVLAKAAGIATGERHNVLFQDEKVVVSSVTFSETLTGEYQPAFTDPGATDMRFARCEVSRAGIANWLIQVLNILPGTSIKEQTVSAAAVATLAPSQITSCAIPVGICSSDVPPSTPVGTWIESVIGPKGSNDEGNLTGNFMWVDFTPPGGGASELAGHLTGPGVCNLPAIGTEVGEAGVISSLANDWNSRFGIYQGNVKTGSAKPDFSGYAYTETNWPSKFDAFSNFQSKRGNNEPYQGNATTGLNVNGKIEDDTYLKQHGEDRRLATAAVVDCNEFGSGTTASVESWACVLMLHPINNSQGGSGTGSTRMFLEYLGRSNQPNSPCATNGVPAGPGGIGPMVPALVR
ncbi:putative Flp pilus-assembly TadE/G-like [Nitrosomonas nitrosa]|uniref:Putative Flp pilus-assembly TadE/G-like n=1 Tax=Nitrosomonas nitrosa TaxID=52442 RepID=A0A8H9D9K1_9PROT|nr:Tad domain-containing protein [Nitrosomonas nitrosa]CAE6494169.1 putative Flp pilus-assembly TadE/G-like [Nitrosomonas nitrosa]